MLAKAVAAAEDSNVRGQNMQHSLASAVELSPEFLGGQPWTAELGSPALSPVVAEADDPFDDFDEDDFDDDFDDDFEEDWEDDLTEDDEFPDTFGGGEEDDGGDAKTPFSDDPNFDDD
jgi:hypothetical protein